MQHANHAKRLKCSTIDLSVHTHPWAPPIKLVDAEVRWFDLWSSWVPPNDTFLCVHLPRTGQVEWYSKDLSSWKTSWQFANKQRLLEHRKHLFMVVVIQEPHLCRFHVLPLHVVIQESHYKIHLGTMPNCFFLHLIYCTIQERPFPCASS